MVLAGVYEPVKGGSMIVFFMIKKITPPIIISPTPTNSTIAQAGKTGSPTKNMLNKFAF